ncbi:MAG: alpha/beta fold hydrolase [Candidatus Shapirobacteria bacterium]|nr:alpha/beta fold hydrolase [Candidatus Shapirobacteria bacterium]MDD4410450.1 alpha/beta fold hydrolase [Candidatus Shapirobacteria bacterium]
MIKNIIFLVVFFFLNCSNVFGNDYLYDDFINKDINKWDFYPNGGSIDLIDGNLILSSSGLFFPYIISKNDNLFTGENNPSLNIKFKYNQYGSMGDGISLGITGIDGLFYEQIQIWRDTTHGSLIAYNDLNTANKNLCSNLGSTNISTETIYTSLDLDNEWHVLKIEKDNTRYKIYIDPDKNISPIFITQENQCEPKRLLIGNSYTGGSTDWNNLSIDSVNIGPTTAPVVKPKIIIIPGLGASWNSEAIVYDHDVGNDQWKMTPFVKNYDGLIDALKENSLEENTDYYVWNYDWRKPLKDIVTDLNSFINQKIKSGEKVILIGHSLGGLTSRIWAEDNKNDSRLEKVITLGSPHLGSVDAYEAWNGGQISDLSKVSSIAFKILLELKGLTTKTNMEAVRTYIPSVKDLLPTFNFVTKNGTDFTNQLETKNDYLKDKNNDGLNSGINLKLYAGNGFKTTNSINLKNNNVFDKVLGIWPDGRINNFTYTNEGDGTVLVKSANYNKNDFVELNSSHGEIVDETIGKIMTEIGLSQVEIVDENEDLKNTLVFFIGSPVNYSVQCDNESPVLENDGFVVIKNNNYRMCNINYVGNENGLIHIVTGNTDNNDWSYWEKNVINGEIGNVKINPKNGEVINNKSNILFLKSIIKEDLNSLLILNKNNKDLKEALRNLDKNQPKRLIKNIFDFREKNGEKLISQKIIDNTNSWLSLINKCSKNEAVKGFKTISNYRDLIESLISNKRNTKISVDVAVDYQKIVDLLELNQKEIKKNDYSRVCSRNFLILNYGNEILKKSHKNEFNKWLLEDSNL